MPENRKYVDEFFKWASRLTPPTDLMPIFSQKVSIK